MNRGEMPDPLRPIVDDLVARGGNVISFVVDEDGEPLSSTSTFRPDVPIGEVEVTCAVLAMMIRYCGGVSGLDSSVTHGPHTAGRLPAHRSQRGVRGRGTGARNDVA